MKGDTGLETGLWRIRLSGGSGVLSFRNHESSLRDVHVGRLRRKGHLKDRRSVCMILNHQKIETVASGTYDYHRINPMIHDPGFAFSTLIFFIFGMRKSGHWCLIVVNNAVGLSYMREKHVGKMEAGPTLLLADRHHAKHNL